MSIARILARHDNDRRLRQTARPLSAFEQMRLSRLDIDTMPEPPPPAPIEVEPEELRFLSPRQRATLMRGIEETAEAFRHVEADIAATAERMRHHRLFKHVEPKSIHSPAGGSRITMERPKKRVTPFRDGGYTPSLPRDRHIPALRKW